MAPVPRFHKDLMALECLLEEYVPRKIRAKLSKTGWVSYGIGDASGNEYRAVMHLQASISY